MIFLQNTEDDNYYYEYPYYEDMDGEKTTATDETTGTETEDLTVSVILILFMSYL